MKKIIILFLLIYSISFAKYNRIIIMAPSMFEVACLLNVEDRVIGLGQIGNASTYPEEKSKNIKKMGNAFRPSIEKLIAENPDLVIVNEGVNFPIEELQKRNINVISFSTKRIDDISNNIKKFATLVGKEKEAEKIINNQKEKLNSFPNFKDKNIKGIFIYSTIPLMAFNNESLSGDIMKVLGIENIGASLKGTKPIINPEFIIQENPDFVAGIMTVDSIEQLKKSIPMLEYTNAGKNNNIFIFNAELIYRNSPRMLEGIEELSKKLENIR